MIAKQPPHTSFCAQAVDAAVEYLSVVWLRPADLACCSLVERRAGTEPPTSDVVGQSGFNVDART